MEKKFLLLISIFVVLFIGCQNNTDDDEDTYTV